MRVLLILICSLTASGSSLSAQARESDPAKVLTLDHAIALALANHPEIEVELASREIANASLVRAEAAFEPVLRGDARLRERTDPINSILSGAPPGALAPTLRTTGATASFGGLLPTGAQYSFFSTVQHESTNSVLALLTPSWLTAAGIEVRQPLLQNRRIDPARRAIRIARTDAARAESSFTRTAADVVAGVERAWWNVVAARSEVETRRGNVALAERQREDTRIRIEGGTQSLADLAQTTAEVERRTGELLAARERLTHAENALRSLIAADERDPLWNAPLELTEVDATPVSGSIEESLSRALDGRPELRELALRLQQHDIEIELLADRLRPQVDLVASYSGRGLAGTENDDAIEPFGPVAVPGDLRGGLGTSLGTLAQNEFPDASIGLAVAIPIGNSAARASLTIAKAQRRQTEAALDTARRRVVLEVRNAHASMESARARLAAARDAREAAEVQLRAERDRVEGGSSITFFVLTRQNEVAAAQLAETLALTDLRRAQSELARSTGTLLETRGVDIAEYE